jgi:hypothetical protein
MQRHADLLQIVDTARPPGRLARRLDGGQKKRNENSDDRNDHQQLDEGETAGAVPGTMNPHPITSNPNDPPFDSRTGSLDPARRVLKSKVPAEG